MEKIKRFAFPTRSWCLSKKSNARKKLGAASRRLIAVPLTNLINPTLRDIRPNCPKDRHPNISFLRFARKGGLDGISQICYIVNESHKNPPNLLRLDGF